MGHEENPTGERTVLNVLRFGTPVAVVALWQFFSTIGWINASVLPAPSTIFVTLINRIANGKFFADVGISLLRVLEGYVLGSVLGIGIGTIMAFSKRFESALSLILNLVRPIPIIAWVPIFIMWLGIGEVSKVAIITFGTFFPVLLNTAHGIRSTSDKLLEVAYSFEKSRRRVFFSVILPSAAPAIFTGLRLGLGLAWMSVVGAEMIGASSGIGYLIAFAGQLSQPDVMLMGVFVIGVIGCLIDLLLRTVERHLMKWNVDL